jgi:choline dehydrogenase
LNVSESKVDRDIIGAWVDAAAQAGYRRTDDYNREDQEGAGFFFR